ncbi:hypothetical protein ATE92_2695 [Ulvibacter sp. MAR_2010_11]|uniref:hypothetical protein n=1 Tax=Ulvibacter sp. MAR_2010_11 TaxID=1250229 RepID=UPI000CBD1E42|nr:hypothetical protein [Ulvibacter sp. MAR_2010_11]PKA84503.1 hypothetical protein ATE92_2695 [Ulvibacter sp. MAR_2010_11]
MNTKLKNRLLFIFSFAMLLFAFAIWYKVAYSMEVAEIKLVNSTSLHTKILVASQGSDFKEAVVINIINFYKKDSIHIKKIDVSQLQQVQAQNYSAIIILHTWEYGKPPRGVTQFITENEQLKHKMIVYATSGAGSNKIEGIDAMSGESIIEKASDVSDTIIEKIEYILKKR